MENLNKLVVIGFIVIVTIIGIGFTTTQGAKLRNMQQSKQERPITLNRVNP